MDRQQFIALVEGEQEGLRRFLLALCRGDGYEADDIAQEALVKAYLAAGGYMDRERFSAWIFKIAYNTFLDHRRRRKADVGLGQAMRQCDKASAADRGLEYQDLYAALDTLPVKERTAILLHYIKGYSVAEIGRIVDCSADAVKKQLSRGREHLKAKIKR